ncbi:hypothetical protein [Persicobacter sp. CCB-QB2]|uniref:hypothetical protein n=1 Tax=Persicobacter sp. CCB-QB2 TaxID=1561025 RepID=UPI0006A9F6A4|nr:hypothetical protein [Persicobacter sp. CCB-QB2]
MKKTLNLLLILCLGVWIAACNENSDMGPNSSTGINGSMAQFAISSDYLFMLNPPMGKLSSYTIHQDNGTLEFNKSKNISREMETLFPTEDYLFIGTSTGVLIYDISAGNHLNKISEFDHIRSCDPVVVQFPYAYSTLRAGNACWNEVNQLDIINLEDIQRPTLVKTIPLENPHGLGIDNDLLFICEGNWGLKVFDISDPIDPVLLQSFQDIHAFDLIPHNQTLVIIGNDGIVQYSYRDQQNIKLISQIQ